jgi:hypothetical protein
MHIIITQNGFQILMEVVIVSLIHVDMVQWTSMTTHAVMMVA